MIVVRFHRTAVLATLLLAAAWVWPASADAAVRHHGKRTAWFEALWPIASSHPVLATSRIASWVPSNDVDDDFDDRDTLADPTSSVIVDTAPSDDAPPPRQWIRRDADPRAERLIVWRKLAAPRPPPSL